MYLNYYRLKKEPFHITPDPDFLFFSESHKQALASIIYCTEKKKGFVAITGGVGLGKTTILRSYLERMDKKNHKLIYVFNPNIPFKSLVTIIFHELGVKLLSYDISEMVHQLHLILIEEYSAGNNIILIVDEAQNMPVDTLENLRMLSNLETSTDKLIQIVLIGQPELDDILNKYELRQLKQRIAIRATIFPLTQEESLAYIQNRLKKAGLKEGQLFTIFTKQALRLIIKHAKGIPRIINILCDNALINGFGHQKCPISSEIIKEVIYDFKIKEERFYLKWQYAALFALLLLFLVFWSSPYRIFFISIMSDILFSHSSPVSAKAEIKPMVNKNIITVPKESMPKIEPVKIKTEQKPMPVVKTIKKGEHLTQLIKNIYGIQDTRPIDSELIELIKKSNPHIKDMNRIPVGAQIVFPAIADK